MKEKIQNLFIRHREVILYLIFGGLTTVISIFIHWLFSEAIGIDPLISNVISWIAAVTFAYLTNRRWVFQSKASGLKEGLRDAASFYVGRLLTLGMEELLLFVGIHLLHIDNMIVKIVGQVIVVIANYVISKIFVFH